MYNTHMTSTLQVVLRESVSGDPTMSLGSVLREGIGRVGVMGEGLMRENNRNGGVWRWV